MSALENLCEHCTSQHHARPRLGGLKRLVRLEGTLCAMALVPQPPSLRGADNNEPETPGEALCGSLVGRCSRGNGTSLAAAGCSSSGHKAEARPAAACAHGHAEGWHLGLSALLGELGGCGH